MGGQLPPRGGALVVSHLSHELEVAVYEPSSVSNLDGLAPAEEVGSAGKNTLAVFRGQKVESYRRTCSRRQSVKMTIKDNEFVSDKLKLYARNGLEKVEASALAGHFSSVPPRKTQLLNNLARGENLCNVSHFGTKGGVEGIEFFPCYSWTAYVTALVAMVRLLLSSSSQISDWPWFRRRACRVLRML